MIIANIWRIMKGATEMNENENTVNITPTEERAFTQDDVNRIVGERLSKER